MSTNPLIGVWSLVTYGRHTSTGQKTYPLGEDPAGQIIYSSTGHMAVTLMRRGRRRFISPDQTEGTSEEIKEAFLKFEAYSGTYDIDLESKTVTHHLQVCKFPNWEGTNQVRHFKLSGDILELVSEPVLLEGQEWVVTLSWQRVS